MFGLITGSGFYDIVELQNREKTVVDTAYGPPVEVTTGTWHGHPVCFLPRHGTDHTIPPQAINYRANVAALRLIGATKILATAVSGGIRSDLGPGTFVLISDYINFTSGRADTFFDGKPQDSAAGTIISANSGDSPLRVVHTDMTTPYDQNLRDTVKRAAELESVPLKDGAVYCTTNGPRFETPAEIAMMAKAGGDLVGMTGYPEVALAAEAGIPYASIGVVSNMAAGLAPESLSVPEIVELIERQAEPLYRLIGQTVRLSSNAPTESDSNVS